MKKIILLFWVLFANTATIAQEWKLEIGSNLTRYVFTNSSGNNPEYLKSSAGYHLGISKENKILKLNEDYFTEPYVKMIEEYKKSCN